MKETAYTWEILGIKTTSDETHQDIATNVQFRLTGVKEVETHLGLQRITAESVGSVDLAQPGEDFIPFADLAEDVVVGWVLSALGDTAADAIATDLERIIGLKVPKAPEPTPRLPWLK
jgi:hypothetical protein